MQLQADRFTRLYLNQEEEKALQGLRVEFEEFRIEDVLDWQRKRNRSFKVDNLKDVNQNYIHFMDKQQ